MKEQLIQYVNLLFAGNPGLDDVRQEILQNTLERYDDLIAQGKTPEAAYSLAISGIGDINEIFGRQPQAEPEYIPYYPPAPSDADENLRRILRAVAIGLFILCPVPLIVLDYIGMDIFGLCGMLAIVAAATMLMLLSRKKPEAAGRTADATQTECKDPNSQLKKSIGNMIGSIGLAVYLILSFATGAWFLTWLIFPIMASIKGLVNACIDLKEV